MKERPILFSTPMVQAILDGRKTQTRRIIKPQPRCSENHLGLGWDPKQVEWANEPFRPVLSDDVMYCGNCGEYVQFDGSGLKIPYGKGGDILWVRETFIPPLRYGTINRYIYKAIEDLDCFKGYWKPSIFMPKEACRIRLEITNIKVERLRDVSREDAINEGIDSKTGSILGPLYKIYDTKEWNIYPIESYKSLWESINGKDSWNLNPWVWVIEFKRVN